jgi:hypothetical protein
MDHADPFSHPPERRWLAAIGGANQSLYDMGLCDMGVCDMDGAAPGGSIVLDSNDRIRASNWQPRQVFYTSFISSGFQFTTCPRSMLRLLSRAAPAAR